MPAARVVLSLLVGLLVGCAPVAPAPTDSPDPPPTSTPTSIPTPTTTATATPSAAVPILSPLVESPSAACINGWVTPAPTDPNRAEGLEILSGYMGVDGLVVEDMRYFIGPDPPRIIEPRYERVERWYIKAVSPHEPDYRGRWLLEKRTEHVLGVSAVAPYETEGYASPHWVGFVGDGPPTEHEGLPGLWSGIPYDFVSGEGDSGYPGLPDEVSGCLVGS